MTINALLNFRIQNVEELVLNICEEFSEQSLYEETQFTL